jgi:N-acetylneuraminic acid mutarotase
LLRPGLLVLLACLFPAANAQTNQWTWMGGSSTVGSNGGRSGVYGVLRTPAAGNVPGSRYGAANWTDTSGHFWLFGGYGYDVNGSFGYLNDVWEFDPATSEWTWMSGSNTVGGHGGQPGVYGTIGTPAAGNTPGSRNFAASWADNSGNLWLFGGWDYDADAIAGELNDFWEFSPSTNQWAWMGGNSTVGPHDGQSGTYGTLGTPAPGNTPGGLFAPSSWTDGSGNFWLLGGQGFDGNGNFHDLNSLLEFDAGPAEWAWMGGSKTVGSNGDVPGVYGTLGTSAAGNIPGNRSEGSSWNGATLWLFGGNGYDSIGNGGSLNDLWEFDPALNQWAWMSGSDVVGSNGVQSGVYGTLGTPAAGNTPGGRIDATAWTDGNGNLWLFGGYGADSGGDGGYLNDLWAFNPANSDWAWMGGSNVVGSNGGQSGVYGTFGTPSAANAPGGRDGANGFTDRSGNLWLFGGYGYDASGNLGYLNDLWKYPPSASSQPGTATPAFSPAAGNYSSTQSVTISDSTAGATIYYTKNGTTPTDSSAVYTGPITVASTETLKAIATASGLSASGVATAAYIINPTAAATPIFSPPAGTYASAQSVTISDSTVSSTIYYTVNGTPPTVSSAVYTGAITVSATETIEAMATASGSSTSSVATAVYTIGLSAAATPTFSLAAGTYSGAQSLTISDSTAGATIYYTTNGTAPTVSSAVYAAPISVSITETIETIAVASGLSTSAVATAAYTIDLPATATPAFSPAPGTFSTPQSVTITDSTAGVTIYYTVNGTPPTVSSAVYTGAITVSATETIEAMATAGGHSSSAVSTGAYIIVLPAATTPTFLPVAGTYSAAQTVTIADSTPGATIYYTTNGTLPTVSSAIYTGTITVSATETLEAMAIASGHSTSAVSTAAYTINPLSGLFAISGAAVTVTAGAVTGNASTITVTPSGGFTGAVALSGNVTASPTGAQDIPTLSFGSTSAVQITDSTAATATLTVTTIVSGSAMLGCPALPGRRRIAFGGAALACVLFFCVPRRRPWQAMFGLIALFAILGGGAVACGSNVTRNAVTTHTGTTPGAYTLTVTGTSGTTVESGTLILTVQ